MRIVGCSHVCAALPPVPVGFALHIENGPQLPHLALEVQGPMAGEVAGV